MTDVSKYEEVTSNLVGSFTPLIKKWKASDAGNLENWINLLKQVMKTLESDLPNEGGVVKGTIAINVVQGLAQILIDENVANLDENQLRTVKLILSDEGVSVLRMSTGLLKKAMNVIDTNRDGKISGEEFKSFWKRYFCCCC